MHSLTLELTNSCPQYCTYCSSDAQPTGNGKLQLAMTAAMRLVDEAEDLCTRKIILSGGEPRLYPYFWSIADEIARRQIRPFVYTCGVYPQQMFNRYSAQVKFGLGCLPDEEAERFKDKGVTVVFNINSADAELHDFYTNTPGSYYIMMQSLLKCLQYKVSVQLNYVPLRTDGFEKIIALAKSLGIPQINVLRLVKQGRAKTYLDVPVTTERQLVQLALQKANRTLVRLGAPYNPLVSSAMYRECAVRKLDKIVVTPDGWILPCEAFKYRKTDFYNIHNQTLKDALESPLFRELQQEAQDGCPVHKIVK